MVVYIAIAAVAGFVGLRNLAIAVLGRFPQFLATTVGTINTKNTHRNVPTKYGGKIPVLTRYTYTYTVNGKKYKYSGEGMHTKGCLLPKVTMVYVKWFPRRAYPEQFRGAAHWAVGIAMLLVSVLFAFVAAVEGVR